MTKETFKTKYGLVLIAAGSAIGLGNIWRFPYIVGKYGGAIFVLFYLFFLVVIGIPMLNIELAVGRASKASPKESFSVLSKNKYWNKLGWISFYGSYILMFFYLVISGWIVNYVYKFINGSIFESTDYAKEFGEMLNSPSTLFIFTIISIIIGFGVLAIGFNKGVENITSKMMVLLLFSIIVLVINSLRLENAMEGIKFYLVPNFENIKEVGIIKVMYEAMNQAFFTLSIGMGSIATFGAKSTDESTTMSSALQIIFLDTFVAIMAGLIIFPATTEYSINQKSGAGLIFMVIPEVFKHLTNGRILGIIFFIFLAFAAISTVIATFEEIIENFISVFKMSRIKSILINFFIITLGTVPIVLGFNKWSWIKPFGGDSNLLDLYDFLVSANILPLGTLGYVLFVMSKSGWNYNDFISEVNKGNGIKLRLNLKFYLKYLLPLLILVIYISGYVIKFFVK